MPPCTSSVSPACSRPRSNTLVHTVKNVSGMAAASTERAAGRHRQALHGGHGAVLGVAAAGDERADRVALAPAPGRAGAGRPDRDDVTGDLETGQVGGARRRRIRPAPLQHVGPVDAGGRHLHQHLARAGHRPRALDQAQHRRAARACRSRRRAPLLLQARRQPRRRQQLAEHLPPRRRDRRRPGVRRRPSPGPRPGCS